MTVNDAGLQPPASITTTTPTVPMWANGCYSPVVAKIKHFFKVSPTLNKTGGRERAKGHQTLPGSQRWG